MEQKTLNTSFDPSVEAAEKRVRKINVEAIAVNVLELHQHVHQLNARIELHTHDGSTCVLMTKKELESLEQALEILSDTDGVRAMRDELSRVATIAS